MRTLYSLVAVAMSITLVSGQTWTNIASDPAGDSGGLEATGIDYWYDDVNDQVQFRITVTNLAAYSTGPAADFSFQLPNGLDSGGPTGTHWTTPGTPVHKTAYVYCDPGGSAPSNYTFTSWANEIEETGSMTSLCTNCVSVMADVANNALIYTFDRQDIITDTEMGGNSATILLVANAGHDVGWDDNITSGDPFTISMTTNVATIEALENIGIYPNPTDDILTIAGGASLTNIKVLDVTGAVISTSFMAAGQNILVDLGHSNPGIYFLELEDMNGATGVKKVIVH